MIDHVDKPWGQEQVWALTDRYCGKVLLIYAGRRLSLQYHERKDETLMLEEGEATLDLDGTLVQLRVWEPVRIKAGVRHRLVAGPSGAIVLEVSTPELDDVVRIEDDYGRVVSTPLTPESFDDAVKTTLTSLPPPDTLRREALPPSCSCSPGVVSCECPWHG